MNSFTTLKIFATSLLVTVLAGPLIQRLLPNWSQLAADVGSGGAWFASIMYHIVYGIIIGAGAALGSAILARNGRTASLKGTAIATGLTVLVFDLGYVLLSPEVGNFAYLALLLALLSLLFQVALSLAGIGVRNAER